MIPPCFDPLAKQYLEEFLAPLGVVDRPYEVPRKAKLSMCMLIFIGVQPRHDKAIGITSSALIATAVVWFGYEQRRFQGSSQGVLSQQRQAEIEAARALGETH